MAGISIVGVDCGWMGGTKDGAGAVAAVGSVGGADTLEATGSTGGMGGAGRAGVRPEFLLHSPVRMSGTSSNMLYSGISM